MADIDYDDYGASPRFPVGQAQRLVQLTGAACSLALIAGVGLWGYRLAVRDVTGVPVIHASEAPMRVAPSNPGGDIADHQGMAVNIVAAVGGAVGLPEEIVLAPAPMDLAADDAPGLVAVEPVAAAPAAAAGPLGLQRPAAAATVVPPAVSTLSLAPAAMPPVAPEAAAAAPLPDAALAPSADAPVTTEDAVAIALAEALGNAVPLEPLADLPPQSESALALTTAEPAATSTVRPRPRPQTLVADTAAVVQPASAVVSVGPEIDPATLVVGTRMVQLGAFDSPEIARSEWVKLRTLFGDLMTGKSLVVQSAQSGGRMFYRLRAHGFDGEDDARRFCAALLAENAACIPVAHR